MKYRILYEGRDRLHLELARGRLSQREADILYYALMERRNVLKVTITSGEDEEE